MSGKEIWNSTEEEEGEEEGEGEEVRRQLQAAMATRELNQSETIWKFKSFHNERRNLEIPSKPERGGVGKRKKKNEKRKTKNEKEKEKERGGGGGGVSMTHLRATANGVDLSKRSWSGAVG